MHHDSAGKRFVSIQKRLVAFAESFGNLLVILFGRDRVSPAALGFDHLVGTGEIL